MDRFDSNNCVQRTFEGPDLIIYNTLLILGRSFLQPGSMTGWLELDFCVANRIRGHRCRPNLSLFQVTLVDARSPAVTSQPLAPISFGHMVCFVYLS